MDSYRIDSHKLIYHIPRVYEWLHGENIYPIYIEIGLFGGCNHRCIFCAFDFLQYKPCALDEEYLKKFLVEASARGIKAILYSGEGEPLLHRDIENIISVTRKMGIDVALSTNGVLLNKEKAKNILGNLTWIRISLNAGSKKSYSAIHRTDRKDFNIVINNLKEAVNIRNKNKYRCTIGVQYLLIPQNYREVLTLARILSDLGVDYLAIKPYCRHTLSKRKIDTTIRYNKLFYLEDKLKKYSKDNFQIIFRRHSMEKIREKKPYTSCLGLPFITYISINGDMYPCDFFLGKRQFIFGNICKENFNDIWEGKRRKKIMAFLSHNWNIRNCRRTCRLDEINRFLWDIKNPPGHVNFI